MIGGKNGGEEKGKSAILGGSTPIFSAIMGVTRVFARIFAI
jgi:hypothetical protein